MRAATSAEAAAAALMRGSRIDASRRPAARQSIAGRLSDFQSIEGSEKVRTMLGQLVYVELIGWP